MSVQSTIQITDLALLDLYEIEANAISWSAVESLSKHDGPMLVCSFKSHVDLERLEGGIVDVFLRNGWENRTSEISQTISEWIPDRDFVLIAEFDLEKIHSYGGRLRALFTREDNPPQCSSILLMTSAAQWDAVNDRTKGSLFPIGTPFNYHEYVIWVKGPHYPRSVNDEKSLTNEQAWIGAGWPGHKYRKALDMSAEDFKFNIPPAIEQQFQEAYSALVKSGEELEELNTAGKRKLLNTLNYQTYRRALCEFLPPHYSSALPGYIPSNVRGGEGGPIKWSGIIDPELYIQKRHLFLDGWLIPFPHGDGVVLQPASIALLYWAAREEGRPHTESPQAFLTKYQWELYDSWFGGRWQPQQS